MEGKERNYWCLILLLLRVGNTKIRLYFKNQWDALGVFPVWTDRPHNGVDLLTYFRPLPYELAKVQAGDTSTWDLSLLVKALLKSVPSFVSDKNIIAALECLRDMRNEFCHSPTPEVEAAVFQKKWQDACNALTLFGATSDEFDRVTLGAEKPWKDLKHLIQQCLNHDKEILNVLKGVTCEIQELREGQENLLERLKQLIKELEELQKDPNGSNQCASLPSPLSEQLDVKLASTKLKSSVIRKTEQKRIGTQVFVNVRTDDIFTNLEIQKYHPNSEGHCEMSSTSVHHIEEIFIGKENPKSIQITGKPGIGKTFFCEKIVRDWAKDQLFVSPASNTIPGFQFAYLLKFRDLNFLEKEVDLCELLNLSSLLDEKSMVDESLMKYFIDNPDKLLIILDGYDEYEYGQNIADNYERQYPNDLRKRMPAQALLSKLINKQILSNSVIVVTSRPVKADELKKIQIDEYVQINGFSPEQVTEFVENYFAANEQMKTKVVEFVKTNVKITSFCHIPMMSFLMCGYLKWHLEKSRHKLPASTTDLFSEMITTFMKEHKGPINTSGETASKSKPIEKVLRKIEKFAAKLLEDKKIVFEEKDMEDNLSPREITILKGSGLLNRGGNARIGPSGVQQLFEFIHLTVQEFMSAQWYVAENKMPKKQTSGMVFQFMSGLLGSKQNNEMMTRIFKTVKPKIDDDYEQIVLSLRCLCEYGDERLADKLLYNNHHLYCNNIGLIVFRRVDDMDCTAISWLLDSLYRLQVVFPFSKLRRVTKLSISSAPLTVFSVKSLCDSVCRLSTVMCLSLHDCNLDDKCAECIGNIIINTNLFHLYLDDNNITDVGAKCLCSNIVRDSCKVITLDLLSNKLITDECRKSLRVYVQTNKSGVVLDI